MFNAYGPTEATVCSTISSLLSGSEAPPIGKPIPNVRVYVLDESLEPVPVSAAGELYIAGQGLARGYLKKPALTAERFVAAPYGPPGTRMYRTGDLVRQRTDGELEFLGRTDDQVKLRGFRVELGEIESVLATQSEVAHAAAVVCEDQFGEKRLVGYIVPRPGEQPDTTVIRQRLSQMLPDYMVPAAIVVLDSFPLTVSGKLNRRLLPIPEFKAISWRAPRTPEEEVLCSLFAEILGVDRVGLDDNFFTRGGHSLLATRLVRNPQATGASTRK